MTKKASIHFIEKRCDLWYNYYIKGDIMKFQILASGSKGNMTYIESNNTHIILDAGISLKEVALRSDINLDNIDAILLTHEHSDHITYLMPLLRKTKATLYAHKKTIEYLITKRHCDFSDVKVQYLMNNKKYLINDITIFTLELSHDASNCNGFIFSCDKSSLAYITDTGLVPLVYMELLKKVNTLIIEANHDIEMLNESDRPWFLKQRILSFKGHLSNITCGEVINRLLKEGKIEKIVLAHLTEECNEEHLAIDTVLSLIEGDYLPKFYVAKQRESLDFIEVKSEKDED